MELHKLQEGIYGNAGTTGAAGTFGKGGNGNSSWGSGGGGGYYGGSGSGYSAGIVGSGSGGSSFISGHDGCNAINYDSSTSVSNIVHTGNAIFSYNQKEYRFLNTSIIAGNAQMPNTSGTDNETGHMGSGYAKIMYLGPSIQE